MLPVKCVYKFHCFTYTDLPFTYRQFEKWREEKNKDVMGIPVKYKKLTLLTIAVLHLVVQGIHGYSHIVANVQISSLQWIFILLVITIAPLAAVYITWRGKIRKGAGFFALSKLSAFLFGYTLHFVLNSPDLHSNIIGEFNNFFFH